MSLSKVHKCGTCGREFQKKSCLKNHADRKNKCKPGAGLSKKLKNHKCTYCGKETSPRLDNHKSHEKTCGPKYNNVPMNIRNTINGNNNTINNTINNNLTNNTVNNNNINIIINFPPNALVPYNHKIDLSSMESHEIDRIFNCEIHPHVVFFELFHCNSERVNYQNVYYMSDDITKIYTGTDFVSKNVGKVINYFIRSQRISMIDYLQDVYKTISDETIRRISDVVVSTQILDDPTLDNRQASAEISRIQKLMLACIKKTTYICRETYSGFTANKKLFDTKYKKKIVPRIQMMSRRMLPQPVHDSSDTSSSSSDSIDHEIEKVEFDYSERNILDFDNAKSSDDTKSSSDEEDNPCKKNSNTNRKKKNSFPRKSELSDLVLTPESSFDEDAHISKKNKSIKDDDSVLKTKKNNFIEHNSMSDDDTSFIIVSKPKKNKLDSVADEYSSDISVSDEDICASDKDISTSDEDISVSDSTSNENDPDIFVSNSKKSKSRKNICDIPILKSTKNKSPKHKTTSKKDSHDIPKSKKNKSSKN